MEQDSPSDRRTVLMLKAQELFAKRGIDAVSLNEINKAAGQRNTSALHYHFGNKRGLVEAIIYEHYAAIDRKLNHLLDEYEKLPAQQQTSRHLLEATITPFTEQLNTQHGVNYLLIVNQVFMKGTDLILKGHPTGADKARLRTFQLFDQLLATTPPEIQTTRRVLCANFMFNSLATYAQIMLKEGTELSGGKALFISNLIDSLHAIIKAPPSTETLALLQTEQNNGTQ